MADISTYTVGTPKASDMVLGTQLADPNIEGDTNKTRNFTVQQITDLAKSIGTLGYTLYSALLTQTGISAPTSIQLQNTIPGTMTLCKNRCRCLYNNKFWYAFLQLIKYKCL